ncbi:MAG TPA: acyltransferase [Sphingomonas sp.]|nr:acyltransferase [Sphingomonas sp.]
MTIEDTKRYYTELDLVRFCSALLVAFFHLGFSGWAARGSRGYEIYQGLFTIPETQYLGFFGWIGVQIFFVISGLVVTQSAEGRSPADFVKGRIERLYPAAWVCATLTLVFALYWGTLSNPVSAYLRSITLFPFGTHVEPQYWTLGSEIAFYFLIFLLLLVRKFHWLERLAVALTFLGTAFIAVLLVAEQQHWPSLYQLARLTVGPGRVAPVYYGQFFGLGMLTFLWSRRKIGLTGTLALPVSLAGCCLQIVDVHNRFSKAPLATADLHPLWWVPVAAFLIAYAVIAASALGVVRATPRGWLRQLGLATYPLYLFHLTIGAVIVRVLWSLGIRPVVGFALSIAILVVASIFIATVVEKPIKAGLRKFFVRVEAGRREPKFLYTPGGQL